MTIFNPCKKCLVQAICRERCEARQSYWDIRSETVDWVAKISMTVAIIGLILNFIKLG